MFTKITEPADIHRVVYYNENKVKEGVAQLLSANAFLKEAGDLTLADKLLRFDQLHELNGARYKTLHISLNFHPSEQKKLTDDLLRQLAADYMEQIGFGDQPFLVYRHEDAGHPHIHIVVTAIREDGTRIDFHNIGKNESEVARKAIETKYRLVKAEQQRKEQAPDTLRPLNVQKLQYGKGETKRGITNVLDAVLDKYKYASLAELNAILSLYRVRADPGEPGGRIHQNKGLLYRMINEKGNHIGVPIKASAFYSRPTMAYLEKRFGENAVKSKADQKRIKNAIDWLLVGNPRSLRDFIEALKEEQIHTVLRQNKEGLVYGLTFVDSHNKSVLNGSDIGKEYTAKRLLEKLGLNQSLGPLSTHQVPATHQAPAPPSEPPAAAEGDGPASLSPSGESLLDALLLPEEGNEKVPWELRVDKKKKKNPSQH